MDWVQAPGINMQQGLELSAQCAGTDARPCRHSCCLVNANPPFPSLLAYLRCRAAARQCWTLYSWRQGSSPLAAWLQRRRRSCRSLITWWVEVVIVVVVVVGWGWGLGQRNQEAGCWASARSTPAMPAAHCAAGAGCRNPCSATCLLQARPLPCFGSCTPSTFYDPSAGHLVLPQLQARQADGYTIVKQECGAEREGGLRNLFYHVVLRKQL